MIVNQLLTNLIKTEFSPLTHKESYIAEHSKIVRFGNIGIVTLALTPETPRSEIFIEIGEIPYFALYPVEIIEEGLNIQINSNKIMFRSMSTTNYFSWRRIVSIPVILDI